MSGAVAVSRWKYERGLTFAGKRVSRPLKFTALAIATFSDAATGENVYPSIPALARLMNYGDEQQLGKHVRELARLGWLIVVDRPRAGVMRRPVVYRLSVPDFIAAELPQPGAATSMSGRASVEAVTESKPWGSEPPTPEQGQPWGHEEGRSWPPIDPLPGESKPWGT